MVKFRYIIMFVILSHCSIDTKSGLWENKNYIKDEVKISEINFDKNQTFADFKKNIILYSKKSKFPNIMDD
tara:strand:- start:85 stop:297 length:213 start_codon:yes stop_codon:yes gene_type:complete